MAGSQARVSLRTTRGSRKYHAISVWISTNESPAPACRQQTRIGRPGCAAGVGPSVAIVSRSTRRASRKKTHIVPCTRS